MENRFEISMLIDYYGTLLTEKQFNVMTLYYNEDLSLAEIAEINKTSRQAIYDLIKRCCKQLHSYDEKLKLSKKNDKRYRIKEELMAELNRNSNLDENTKKANVFLHPDQVSLAIGKGGFKSLQNFSRDFG